MELSASAQMFRGEVVELKSVLGLEDKEAADALTDVLEELAKPPVPQFNPQEFVTGMTLEAAKAQLKTTARPELERFFLYFFPRGTPQLLSESDLRSYIGAAVNYRKKVMGNCP